MVQHQVADFSKTTASELINSQWHIRRHTSNMKCAAIGVRMHSGWGALVAVSNSAGTVEIIDRRRVAITSPGTPGANQPYHFAENLELPDAEKFLGNCFAASKQFAMAAVRDAVNELHGRQYRILGSAVLLASGSTLPPLSKILASHALIHAAEGEFFRKALSKACEGLGLSVTGFRERELDECVRTTFGKAAPRLRQQISTWSFSRAALDEGSENGGACCVGTPVKQTKVIAPNRRSEDSISEEQRPWSFLGKYLVAKQKLWSWEPFLPVAARSQPSWELPFRPSMSAA